MAAIDTTYTLADYVSLLKRRRRILLTVMPGALLAAIFLAFWLPAEYESTATILIEASTIPTTMVVTTVKTDSDQQIEMVKRNALSSENLRGLVERVDPYPNEPDLSIESKISMVRAATTLEKVDPITFKPLANGSAFTVRYSNPDRAVAKAVMQQIAELFLEYNRKTRSQAAEMTYQFLLQKSEQVDAQIREADQKVAEFKRRYGAALPEDRVRNEVSLERSRAQLDDLDGRIRGAEQREKELQLQLEQTSPTLVGAVADWRTELAKLRADLASAEQRYTPDHPDVRRLRRAVADLVARGGPESAGTAAPDNPDYLRVSSALAASRRELAALQQQAARARGEMQSSASNLALTPGVEKEYVELQRSQAVARDQFADIQEKLQTAEFAKTFESEVQGERYTLIRNASSPTSPSSPNRIGLILMGLVLGGALGIGLAALAETSDSTVRSYHDVRQISSATLLGTVPVLLNPADKRRRKLLLGAYAVVMGLAVLTVGMTVARAADDPSGLAQMESVTGVVRP
jgi:polysaccharide biosynthesis transport protein